MNTTLNIEAFNPKKAELQKLAKETAPVLEIEITDKKSRETVHKAQMKLRENRLEIEKTGKKMREDALAFQKKVIAVQNEYIGIISPIEDELKAKKEAYDEEIKRQKEEEERKKQEAITNRMKALANYGKDYDTLIHAPGIMSEEDFGKIIASLEAEKQEQERLKKEQEEKERKEREEFERKQKELEAEKERLRKIEVIKNTIKSVGTLEGLEEEKEAVLSYGDEYNWEDFESLYKERKEYLEFQEEKRKLEAEKRRIEQEKIDAENEKKRQIELEKARKEAEEKAKRDAELEAERKRLEAEKKKREEEEKKKVEEEKLARRKKYKLFLDWIGYSEEEKDKFTFIDTNEWRKFYKLVGIYK